MIDLTPDFERALTRIGAWDQVATTKVLDLVAGLIDGACVDWERGDEDWGRVVRSDGTVAALVCARIPLGFICAAEVDINSLPDALIWMQVQDMSTALFSVDKETLERAFGRELSDNVDFSALAVDDLWWATV